MWDITKNFEILSEKEMVMYKAKEKAKFKALAKDD